MGFASTAVPVRPRFGSPATNADGIVVTPVEVDGVHFIMADLGDQLPLPEDLCRELSLPLGSVESNQCEC